MRFSAVILATSAMSALSGVSAHSGNGVGELRARSAKVLLHLALRSLDDEQAEAVFARYFELDLAERDEEESSSLFRRDLVCPYCGWRTLNGNTQSMADHVSEKHTNSRRPSPPPSGRKAGLNAGSKKGGRK